MILGGIIVNRKILIIILDILLMLIKENKEITENNILECVDDKYSLNEEYKKIVKVICIKEMILYQN